MGDDPRPLMSDARQSDRISVFRDVTASTKSRVKHSKGAGQVRNQRLCLVPHTCRFLGQRSLGVEPAVKAAVVAASFTFVPRFCSRKGTPGPTMEECCVGNGFCTAKFRHPPKKKGPDALEAKCRVLFAWRLWGTGRRHHPMHMRTREHQHLTPTV
jgi:hypothetical protein